jgi:hypothetical protein
MSSLETPSKRKLEESTADGINKRNQVVEGEDFGSCKEGDDDNGEEGEDEDDEEDEDTDEDNGEVGEDEDDDDDGDDEEEDEGNYEEEEEMDDGEYRTPSWSAERMDAFTQLCLDFFAAPTLQDWDNLVVKGSDARESGDIDTGNMIKMLAKMLRKHPVDDGSTGPILLDGSVEVRSSLGHDHKGGGSWNSNKGRRMLFQLAQICRPDLTYEMFLENHRAASASLAGEMGKRDANLASKSRPSAHSTVLSRFDLSLDSSSAAASSGPEDSIPLNISLSSVLEARCEVLSESIKTAFEGECIHDISLSGHFLGACGSSGYKNRSPCAYIWTARDPGSAELPPRASLSERCVHQLASDSSSAPALAAAFLEETFGDGSVLAHADRHCRVGAFGRRSRVDAPFIGPCRAVAVEPPRAGCDAAAGRVWLSERGGGRIKGFDLAGDRCVSTLSTGFKGGSSGIAVVQSSARTLLVTAGAGGTLLYWNLDDLDPNTGGERYCSASNSSPVCDDDGRPATADVMTFDEIANRAFLDIREIEVDATRGEEPHGLMLFDMPEARPLTERQRKAGEYHWKDGPHKMMCKNLCFLGAPELLALTMDGGGPDGNGVRFSEVICLLDVSTGAPAGHLFGHAPTDCDCMELTALAAGGLALPNTLASSGADLCVKIWDVRSKRPTHTLVGRERELGQPRALAFAPVGGAPILFSGSADQAIKCWDLRANAKCLYELATGNAEVEALAWHAEGCSLIALTLRENVRQEKMQWDQLASESEEEEEEEEWGEWPRDGVSHEADAFGGVLWDTPEGDQALVQYRFMRQPRQPNRCWDDNPSADAKADIWRYISEAY